MLFHLLASDTCAGRVDYGSLPDQARMEMLIADLHGKFFDKSVKMRDGSYTDWETWSFVFANGFKNTFVLRMNEMYHGRIGGSLALEFLPETCTEIHFVNCMDLFGTFETSDLHNSLSVIEIENCSFSGTFDMRELPTNLVNLEIREVVEFRGTCDLTELPVGMRSLIITYTSMSGSISLAHLPQYLTHLDLSFNQFSGDIILINIPSPLERVDLQCNNLRGELRIPEPSVSLKEINISSNEICGTAVIHSVFTPRIIENEENAIELVIDENGLKRFDL